MNSFIPNKNVEVPDLPFDELVKLPAENTAMIIVDMQNDFVKEKGSLLVPSALKTIDNIKSFSGKMRKAGVKIFYTQDTHYEGDKEWEIWPEHCRKDSWGWQIIDELKPQKDDMVIQKNRYDGFYGSNLEHYLSHVFDIKNLIITGTVSSICVLHTTASAGLRWYFIVVPANGISALTEFDQALTLRQVSSLYGGKIVKEIKHIKIKQ